MKIELTKSQLLRLLSQHFNTPVTDVIIRGSEIADVIKHAMSQFRYTTDQKIHAIKHLRQLSIDCRWLNGEIMGVGDAKWAVENFSVFIDFVQANDRLPLAGYSELK